MTASDPLRDLGVRMTSHGGELRVWSHAATSMELAIFDDRDPSWAVRTVTMTRDAHDVWTGRSRSLVPGRSYAIRVGGPEGPNHAFDPKRLLLDPYARGLVRVDGPGSGWRSTFVDDAFDWGGVQKPRVPLDHAVIYEAHVRGFSKRNPAIPAELRGSYAGLAHESSIAYLKSLGVTTVELLPVQAFVSEQRLVKQGLTNYWGYNTLGFFAPHAAYASRAAQAQGSDAVLREFKGMVRLLHEAGLEVILDVVYNHTAEEGPEGPVYSFRGIDNASYYRQDAHGHYVDTTGCGNAVYFGKDAPIRLVLDSMRYWAEEVQIDGFRLDLAATLGRGEHGDFERDHPLLRGMLDDPILSTTKIIAEPWDVGYGGWQTGNFARGFVEWNDRYRDRMRDFWLGDIRRERETGSAGSGIGRFATRLAGSSNTFSLERGPLAGLNFITAHDGFTMADLVAYDTKHNLGNGEDNRDGTSNNNSFNHGVEGDTTDETILATRRKAIRNLLGTLLLSAGVPMLTAGDEYGRSQRGNNNAYCHDSELTWLDWEREEWQQDLEDVTRTILRLRHENPALRPVRFGRFGEETPSASRMEWFNAEGVTMSEEDWNSPAERTLQYVAASTPEVEQANRVLLVVHAHEEAGEITLATAAGATAYTKLWDSADERPGRAETAHSPGDVVSIEPTSMQLYRAD
ncbi:glycogen debranching protein GlgX [Agromyces atrinae]|uniref:Glycogen debranching enzyme GlgX n=1 Tax=Agromyces atrinae TaxID=592376 RepID=A0A4Q2M7B6_9MICO|nr:glycogen debranching protein GlgX [Agromyces atrinae]NYD66535.1 glycogen operon protein [Agromyces atrinae]RXZ87207.1 glycogen debranching enzyme GlgX [Agromyces atrinae]